MSRLPEDNRSVNPALDLPSGEGIPTSSVSNRTESYGKLFLLFRLLFGAIFLAASMDKILNPEAFARVIYNYQLLPDSAINLVAILLPWTEAVLGVSILAGFWLPGALSVANLLLIAFSSTLAYNLLRGLDVQCGCFSTSATASRSVWVYVLRDLAFLSLGAFLFARTFFRPVAMRCSKGARNEWLEEPSGSSPS